MDRIFEFEKANPKVAGMKVNNIHVWTIYRFHLKFMLLRKNLSTASNGIRFRISAFVRGVLDFMTDLVRFIGDFPVIFRRYRYIVVTNNLEVRHLDGQRVDKLAHNLIRIVGEDKTLVLCYGAARKANRHSYKYCISASFIDWLAGLRWMHMRVIHEDRFLLDKLQQEFGLNDIVLGEVNTCLKKVKVLQWLLSFWKPQILFSCCYSNYAEINAANQSGICTVELQHGIISPLHAGYEAAIPLEKNFTSKVLWTFGKNSTRGLSGNLVQLSSVKQIGNFFLEAIAGTPLQRLEGVGDKPGKTVVCVPVDAYTEEHILSFLAVVAKALPHVIFYINPRVQLSAKAYSLIEGSASFTVIAGVPFQLLVRHCAVHTATDSTCCLEALSLGVQNILINDNGSAMRYYGDLVDPMYNKFADDHEAYIRLMSEFTPSPRSVIIASNKDNYTEGNFERIREGLAKLETC